MLVLSRRAGQALRIGDAVEVQLLRVEGDRVVLGIVAPREVAVVRAELVEQVSAEVRLAAGARERVRNLLKPSIPASDTPADGQTARHAAWTPRPPIQG